MRKQILFAAVLLLAALTAGAQEQEEANEQDEKEHDFITIKYCYNYKSLDEDSWVTADSVWLVSKDRPSKRKKGAGNYTGNYIFNSDNKSLRKYLQRKAFAVMYNDTLLINAYPYNIASGYGKGFRMKDGRIVFRCVKGFDKNVLFGVGFMGGMIGEAIYMSLNANKAYKETCYLISPEDDYPTVIKKGVIKNLLKDNPELFAEYKSLKKKDKNDADRVLSLLMRAKLLKEEE